MRGKLLALLLLPALAAGCAAPTPRVAGAVDLIPQHEAGDRADFQANPRADAAWASWGPTCCGRCGSRGRTPCSPRCRWPWPCP